MPNQKIRVTAGLKEPAPMKSFVKVCGVMKDVTHKISRQPERGLL